MRYWKKAIQSDLTYDEAVGFLKALVGQTFITRPDWQGFHYIGMDGRYRVFFNDGHYELIETKEVWAKDKTDWMVVTLKPITYRLLKGLPNGGIVCPS